MPGDEREGDIMNFLFIGRLLLFMALQKKYAELHHRYPGSMLFLEQMIILDNAVERELEQIDISEALQILKSGK